MGIKITPHDDNNDEKSSSSSGKVGWKNKMFAGMSCSLTLSLGFFVLGFIRVQNINLGTLRCKFLYSGFGDQFKPICICIYLHDF